MRARDLAERARLREIEPQRRFLRAAVIYMHIRRHCAACRVRREFISVHGALRACVRACVRAVGRGGARRGTTKLYRAARDVLVRRRNPMNIRYEILLRRVTPRVMRSIID